MRIIAKSRGISRTELYHLMTPKAYTNMRDKVGETLDIKKFSIHQEPDDFNGVKKILSIETVEGEIVVSASRSLVGEFEKIVAIFGANGADKIVISEEETGGGFDVLSCRLSSMEPEVEELEVENEK